MQWRRTIVWMGILAWLGPFGGLDSAADGDLQTEARHENRLQQIDKEIRVYRQATQDAVRLEKEFRRSRQRRYPRGEALQQMREDLEAARAKREEAAERIPMLIERARRDGVAPGRLRRYEDMVPASDS